MSENVSEIKGDLKEFNHEDFQDIQGLSKSSDELSEIKHTYSKTNDKYYDKFNRENFINKFKNNHTWCSLFCDLDHFQKINKQYTCEVGNQILIELENLIKKNCIFDKDELEIYEEFERYGGFERYGEKFIIFLIDIDLDLAHEIAEKIRSSVETHRINFNEIKPQSITLSIGVSGMNSSVKSYKDLLNHAEEACKTAKEYGRNQVVIWENEQISIRMYINYSDLYLKIYDNTYSFVYKPNDRKGSMYFFHSVIF
ncbi:46465_t:CDS:2 [Gigaspora margarita]|uniref:46465_t:CDS:1 n=1 Tax=Gigaspora margarita TaxID=4874 RepID=A0ABN7V076_GIGMA|nr:46465_t:CDS:2 [Gigaspora margarita]